MVEEFAVWLPQPLRVPVLVSGPFDPDLDVVLIQGRDRKRRGDGRPFPGLIVMCG